MIVDASVLVAAANDLDPDAVRCRKVLQSASGTLLVPAPALTEAAYLIQKRLGVVAEIRLIHSLLDNPWKVVGPDQEDLRRTGQLMTQYADLPLGFSARLPDEDRTRGVQGTRNRPLVTCRSPWHLLRTFS